MASGARPTTAWNLSALLGSADPRASQPERHLWLVRLMEWLRRTPSALPADDPAPVLRLRHLFDVLDQQPAERAAVQGVLQAFLREIDAVALFADFGFSHRVGLGSALWQRLRAQVLPGSPATADLATLFPLLFEGDDAAWLAQLDDTLLARIAALAFPPEAAREWLGILLDALIILVSAVQAAGFSSPLRQRMSPELHAGRPFRQLGVAAERLRAAVLAGERGAALQQANTLRALLDGCRRATDSIAAHLEDYGVSVDIVFEADQLKARMERAESLLDCVLAEAPAPALRHLLVSLVRTAGEQRGVRRLMARHYSQLARQVAERSAETGEHYITRNRAEYTDMLRRAAGGGLVVAGTVFVKFALLALGLSAFWSGFWAGTNFAASFVIIMLMQWTLATKQPAMTAHALAAKLGAIREDTEEHAAAIEDFVDEVAHLIRSQAAGIIGNLAMCAPVVGAEQAGHVLDALTLLGPTALFAAFTGVLLFASSVIAGWCENWFVFHRLDGAIAWNPRIVARLGPERAQRWAAWWRANISGLAANVSLGMLLGLVPVVCAFFGLPIEARHVTLSTGQLALALGAEGFGLLLQPVFWWCVAGIAVTGVLNLGVSFWMAFKVALRSRGIQLGERRRIYAAIRRRLIRRPLSFLLPAASAGDG